MNWGSLSAMALRSLNDSQSSRPLRFRFRSAGIESAADRRFGSNACRQDRLAALPGGFPVARQHRRAPRGGRPRRAVLLRLSLASLNLYLRRVLIGAAHAAPLATARHRTDARRRAAVREGGAVDFARRPDRPRRSKRIGEIDAVADRGRARGAGPGDAVPAALGSAGVAPPGTGHVRPPDGVGLRAGRLERA